MADHRRQGLPDDGDGGHAGPEQGQLVAEAGDRIGAAADAAAGPCR